MENPEDEEVQALLALASAQREMNGAFVMGCLLRGDDAPVLDVPADWSELLTVLEGVDNVPLRIALFGAWAHGKGLCDALMFRVLTATRWTLMPPVSS
jgi:hypothetical protein